MYAEAFRHYEYKFKTAALRILLSENTFAGHWETMDNNGQQFTVLHASLMSFFSLEQCCNSCSKVLPQHSYNQGQLMQQTKNAEEGPGKGDMVCRYVWKI